MRDTPALSLPARIAIAALCVLGLLGGTLIVAVAAVLAYLVLAWASAMAVGPLA